MATNKRDQEKSQPSDIPALEHFRESVRDIIHNDHNDISKSNTISERVPATPAPAKPPAKDK